MSIRFGAMKMETRPDAFSINCAIENKYRYFTVLVGEEGRWRG
jgi:hypothetical protein